MYTIMDNANPCQNNKDGFIRVTSLMHYTLRSEHKTYMGEDGMLRPSVMLDNG